jgi:VanZ family protein
VIPRPVAWAALGVAALLVLALFLNGNDGPKLAPPWDKAAHFGYFFVLTVALWTGLRGQATWQVLLVVAAVGIADEWRQLYLSARQASAADLAADLLAAGTALALLSRGAAFAAQRYGGK